MPPWLRRDFGVTTLGLKGRGSLRRKRYCAPLTRDAAGYFRDRFGATPCYLFAYGTLLTESPDRTIDQLISEFLRPKCRAYVQGRLYDLGTYPGAVLSPDRSEKIFGQVFTVERPRQVLPTLDAYEGYNAHYPHRSEFVRRDTTARQLPGQRPLTVWIYYYNGYPRGGRRLLSGDYLAASPLTGAIRSNERAAPQSAPHP